MRAMAKNVLRSVARVADAQPVENPPGIFRVTMAYNQHLMLCHFTMKKGASVPLHSHPEAQNGFVIRGRLRMTQEQGPGFVAEAGTGYCFLPREKHGAEVLEDSEVIECFAPLRTDYAV